MFLHRIYENSAFLLEKKCFNKLQIKRINYSDIWHCGLVILLKNFKNFYFKIKFLFFIVSI
jgi:hypothetical protein